MVRAPVGRAFVVSLRLTVALSVSALLVVYCHRRGAFVCGAVCFRSRGAVRVGYLWVEGWCVCVAGVAGLWSVDADGLVSVADDSVLRGVAVDAAWRGVGYVC